MNKQSFLFLSFIFILGLLAISSCKKDDDEVNEFIADNTTYADWANWSLETTLTGDDPALGGFAHGVADGSSRTIYFKDDQNPVGDSYPIGTLIAKHVETPTGGNAYMAMAKRGNDFNPGFGDWEFFFLKEDGSIDIDADGNMRRGAALNNGGCRSCHSGASTDFVFAK